MLSDQDFFLISSESFGIGLTGTVSILSWEEVYCINSVAVTRLVESRLLNIFQSDYISKVLLWCTCLFLREYDKNRFRSFYAKLTEISSSRDIFFFQNEKSHALNYANSCKSQLFSTKL